MASAFTPLRELSDQLRQHTAGLAISVADPHAEMMAMVWGTRFDRQHALDLLAKLPQPTAQAAQPLLKTLHQMADYFDHAAPATQQDLRRLILRHRALSHADS